MEQDETFAKNRRKNLAILIINTVVCACILAGAAVYDVFAGGFAWYIDALIYAGASLALIGEIVLFFLPERIKWKESIFKLIFVVAICALVLIPVFMVSKSVLHLETKQDVRDFIASTGAWSMVIYVLIQVLQVVVLPLPAFIFYGAGTLLYPAWLATLLASVGVVIGSLIAFSIGKIFGLKVVTWIAGKEQTMKYREMFGHRGKTLFVIMQILPFFPDDILCMVAGLTSMSYLFFTAVIVIVRPIVIAVYCFGFEFIPFDQAWGIAVWVVIVVVCVVLGILSFKYQDRMEAWIRRKFAGREKKSDLPANEPVDPASDYSADAIADPRKYEGDESEPSEPAAKKRLRKKKRPPAD